MNHLAIDIFNWAEGVFPTRTDQSMFVKLFQELGELSKARTIEEKEDEFGDVQILLLDYARRHGINPSLATQRKLAVNRTRQWEVLESGVMQHVRGSESEGT